MWRVAQSSGISSTHFSVDALLAVWSYTNREVALRHLPGELRTEPWQDVNRLWMAVDSTSVVGCAFHIWGRCTGVLASAAHTAAEMASLCVVLAKCLLYALVTKLPFPAPPRFLCLLSSCFTATCHGSLCILRAPAVLLRLLKGMRPLSPHPTLVLLLCLLLACFTAASHGSHCIPKAPAVLLRLPKGITSPDSFVLLLCRLSLVCFSAAPHGPHRGLP